METCSCFQSLKNGLKIAFHSNDKALELIILIALIILPPNSRILGLFWTDWYGF